MSKKLSDLDKDQQRNISADVDTGASILGVDCIFSEGLTGLARDRLAQFGLCADCKHFRYATSIYKVRRAYCYQLTEYYIITPLTDADPIVDCTEYDKRGVMDIHDMKQIAWLIDPSDKEIGF